MFNSVPVRGNKQAVTVLSSEKEKRSPLSAGVFPSKLVVFFEMQFYGERFSTLPLS